MEEKRRGRGEKGVLLLLLLLLIFFFFSDFSCGFQG
jgi:hypothetical protein